MPIGNKVYLNNSYDILLVLLEKGESIPYRKKISGIGLNSSSFGRKNKKSIDIQESKKIIPGSRKIFHEREEEFLFKKYITPLKSDKKNSKCYSITPIGIAYLFSHLGTIDKYQVKSAFRFFESFYNSGLEKDSIFESYHKWFGSDTVSLDKIFSSLDSKQISDIVKIAANSIKIEQSEEKLTILLSYSLNDFNLVYMKRFEIFNDKIIMRYMDDSLISYFKEKIITESYFFRAISEHFTNIFYFTILEYCFNELEKRRSISYSKIRVSKNNIEKQIETIERVEKLFSPESLKRSLMFKHMLSRSLYVQQNRLADFEKFIGYKLKNRGITNLPIDWN